MLFSEIYGSYFSVVSDVLTEAAEKALTQSRLTEIVRQKAFAESILTIPAALRSGWPLLTKGMDTPLKSVPIKPLTLLEKRWLKALLDDPRIRLFSPCDKGLENIEPLFRQDMLVFFDRYSDGDPYTAESYITNFKTVLTALHECRRLRIDFKGRTGAKHSAVCTPYRLEYSSKDDKFRLTALSKHDVFVINMARVASCKLLEAFLPEERKPLPPVRTDTLIIELVDERNALERALLHFSHLEKQTERLSDDRYRMTLRYDHNDEPEMLIRVLSFGPMLRVISPDSFIEQIKKRIEKQESCGL